MNIVAITTKASNKNVTLILSMKLIHSSAFNDGISSSFDDGGVNVN